MDKITDRQDADLVFLLSSIKNTIYLEILELSPENIQKFLKHGDDFRQGVSDLAKQLSK